ncbi:MAG: peptide-binding protein [Candidatus Hydrogenedentes bacterium]|nr:peptide-binding protein [Candidatus Hydrogenedentota bacterium]
MQFYKSLSAIVLTALIAPAFLAGCGGSGGSAPEEANVGATSSGSGGGVDDGGSAAGPSALDAPDEQLGAPPVAEGPPVEGDWIVVRLNAEPPTLNPLLEVADAYTQRVVGGNGGNIFETLLERDNETQEFKPLLAERYEVSDDHLRYTFYLRQNARFSDGAPLTAHDVLFTYEAIQNPAHDCADRRSYLVDFESATVLDDYTIQFQARQPYFLHLSVLGSIEVVPKHIYSQGDFNRDFSRAPVGSGPYALKQWDTGQQVVIAKRADYWGEKKPWVNEIHYKFITDDNAALQLLRRGELDEMRMSAEQWVRHAPRPEIADNYQRITMYSPVDGYAGTFGWIGWNAKRPFFSDNRVRKAMTMLLDRDTIGETIYHGLVRTVSGSMFPDSPAYDQSIAPWPFDPEQAAALLEEAGWTDSDRDGIRDKDGTPFSFQWIFPTGSPEYEQLATVYKEELDRAGIDVTLRPLEWATFLESVTKRTFDACSMAWVSPIESDPYQIWHSSQAENGSNYVGFVNEEADRLIEAARLEFDADRRAALYREFHAILHEEQPYTFLYNSKRKVVVSNRFQNVKPYTLGFDMREWWVPLDQQRYR